MVEMDGFGVGDREAVGADQRASVPFDHRAIVIPWLMAEITYEYQIAFLVLLLHQE